MSKKKIFPKNSKECNQTNCFKECGYMKTDSSGGECTAPDFDKKEENQKNRSRKKNKI